MAGYVYVVSARGLDQSKIGCSSNFLQRLHQLENNSASSVRWQPWSVYRLETISDARRLESLVLKHPDLATKVAYGKREFFDCSPSHLTRIIELGAQELGLSYLRNFPWCWEGVQEVSSNFPSLPVEVLTGLSSDQQKAYWLGFSEAVRVLSYFEGLSVSRGELMGIWGALKRRADLNEASGWQIVLSVLDGSSSLSTDEKHEAMRRLLADAQSAHDTWQES